jgi:hypothetical protein
METNNKQRGTVDNKDQQTTPPPANPNPSSPEQNSNSIKLPGLEIGFPTTWSGSLFGLGIVSAIVIIFLSFSPEFREKIVGQITGIQSEQKPEQTEVSVKESGEVAFKRLQDEIDINAKLQTKLAEQNAYIVDMKAQLSELEINSSAKNTNRKEVAKLVENATNVLKKTTYVAEKPKTAEETANEIVTKLAAEKPYRILVEYFSNKKTRWTKNYLWVSLSRVEGEITKAYPSVFIYNDSLMEAISRLVDLKVLAKTQMSGGTIGYGVQQNSPTFELFTEIINSDKS